MSLRILSTRIIQSSTPLNKVASMTILRSYTTKKYTKDHEWVSVYHGVGTVGVTDYAQKALGDIVFVETPVTGDSVSEGEQIGAIESVKAASDIYAPVSGKVVDVNGTLSDEPTLINTNPEDKGWLFKVKLSNESELDSLLDKAAYDKLVESIET
ncbi:glycine cleavage system H protein [Halteromyces radiatus]|uniref:glycine cleavage system H protein n=1 Tax=Halteromyces radiatus TaxID=101107 RepID=UPI00221E5D54|nr:glycine cleavage system H protein [Halteromyces radiatus]KAI8097246.1 glycine cleavage system H protein [Halteromyces radiatus]